MSYVTDYTIGIAKEYKQDQTFLKDVVPNAKVAAFSVNRDERIVVDHSLSGPVIQSYPVRRSNKFTIQLMVPNIDKDNFLKFIGPMVDFIAPNIKSYLVFSLGKLKSLVLIGFQSRSNLVQGSQEISSVTLQGVLLENLLWE